jgi:hypothetical protein
MEGLSVKLGFLLVISSVSTMKLRPPFVVLEAPFDDLPPLFVVLTPLPVNSLRPFVT